MMGKNKYSLSSIKKIFNFTSSQKNAAQAHKLNRSAELKTSIQGLVMRSWCENTESCLTDCQDYCKKNDS